jgi:hypothetical protein
VAKRGYLGRFYGESEIVIYSLYDDPVFYEWRVAAWQGNTPIIRKHRLLKTQSYQLVLKYVDGLFDGRKHEVLVRELVTIHNPLLKGT